MARYKADISGARGSASRLGTVSSGIEAHVRGWDIGVRVYGCPNSDADSEDGFTLYVTGGSNNSSDRVLIGFVTMEDGAPVFRSNYDSDAERIRKERANT